MASDIQFYSLDSQVDRIIKVPERTNMELGITLSDRGLIIAGYLVSEIDTYSLIRGFCSVDCATSSASSCALTR